jgi:nitrogen fixation protein FixH
MARDNSVWRWFPVGMGLAMAVVFAVNGGMIYAAMHSFPGSAGEDGFDLSNAYDRVLAVQAKQKATGWRVAASVDAGGHPVLLATDRDGRPLTGAVVLAQAERPVGPAEATRLTLTPGPDGALVANEALAPGQWVISVSVSLDGKSLNAVERMVIR